MTPVRNGSFYAKPEFQFKILLSYIKNHIFTFVFYIWVSVNQKLNVQCVSVSTLGSLCLPPLDATQEAENRAGLPMHQSYVGEHISARKQAQN